MSSGEHPFLDPARVRGDLYARPTRLASRTHALMGARVRGTPVVDVLTHLLTQRLPAPLRQARVLDVGCGRGTTSQALASLDPAVLVALDLSPALAATTSGRLPRNHPSAAMCADYHRLPFASQTFDAAVAAFCLYHSPEPARVIAEISRCLRPGGRFVAVTKCADSYSELDELLTELGLAPPRRARSSLYSAANSTNIADLAEPVLDVDEVIHEQHVFRFSSPEHLAQYLVTTPKYDVTETASDLAAQLQERGCPTPVEATSTVTYLVGVPRG